MLISGSTEFPGKVRKMLNWDIESLNLQQEEMIRQAQQDLLAEEVIADARKLNPNYHPALAWFGHRIMAFGGKLVEIYGDEKPQDKQSIYSPDIHLN